MYKYILGFGLATLLISSSCNNRSFSNAAKNTTAGFYEYEIECLGTELDGSQQVRSFGAGANREDAREQAKKNAVFNLLFKGTRLGRTGCDTRPIVFNQNTYDEKREFFNEFFKDNGPYKAFVTKEDTPRQTKVRLRAEGREKVFSLRLTVLVSELRKELKSKGIIE